MIGSTTVTYFRTGLDKFDGYRLADIFSGVSVDTSTPAATLASHLREVNPAVSWFDDVAEFMEIGMDMGKPMHFDAVTFEHGGSAHVVAAIKSRGITDPGWGRRFSITASPWFRDSTFALATSSGLEEKTHRTGEVVRLQEDAFYRDEYVSEKLARRTESFKGNTTRISCYATVNGRGAVQVDPPNLTGFESVEWGSNRWLNRYTEILGTHALGDITSEDNTPIMSSIAQGAGYVPLIELREIN